MVYSFSWCINYSTKRQYQMVMVFFFAEGNHHSETYGSRQAQGPGTLPQET